MEQSFFLESKNLLSVLDSLQDAVVVMDKKGTIVWMNDAVRRVSGHPKKDLLNKGLGLLKIFPPKSVAKMLAANIKRRMGKKVPPYEVELTKKNGKPFFVEVVGAPFFEDGKIAGTVVVLRDITERKRSEKLLFSKNLFDMIKSASFDGIIVSNEKGKILSINEKCLELFGMEKRPENLVGETFIKSASKVVKSPRVFLKRLKGLLKNKKSRTREEVPLNDGRTLVEYSAPLKSFDGKFFGRMWFLRDITYRKKAENKLKETYEKLVELDEAKDRFLTMVSHELRTPLFPAKGYVESLLSGDLGELSGKQKEALKTAHKNLERLLELVEDILVMSRLENKKLKFYPVEFDLDKLLRELVSNYEPEAEAKGLELSYKGKRNAGVKADPERIERAVKNLVDNAIRFTESGGIAVTLSSTKKGLKVLVTDTGIGISDEHLPHVFDRFFQANLPPTGKKGAGLGLPLTKAIIEQHGGEMLVKSEPGKGTSIGFILPCKKSGKRA